MPTLSTGFVEQHLIHRSSLEIERFRFQHLCFKKVLCRAELKVAMENFCFTRKSLVARRDAWIRAFVATLLLFSASNVWLFVSDRWHAFPDIVKGSFLSDRHSDSSQSIPKGRKGNRRKSWRAERDAEGITVTAKQWVQDSKSSRWTTDMGTEVSSGSKESP